MNIQSDCIYHVYNRGNQQQPIFFQEKNYWFFLQKAKHHISPIADIISYCLMPNHFHFLIHMNERSTEIVAKTNRDIAVIAFSKQWRILLSSYTRALQKQEDFTGSLFQQKTKAKLIHDWPQSQQYLHICQEYLIYNPVNAMLVDKPEDWPFSSCLDIAGLVSPLSSSFLTRSRSRSSYDWSRRTSGRKNT